MTLYAVRFHGRQYNTSADSPQEAVRIAMRECVRPWWKGPLITSRTVCEVTMCYPPHTKWTIKASDVRPG